MTKQECQEEGDSYRLAIDCFNLTPDENTEQEGKTDTDMIHFNLESVIGRLKALEEERDRHENEPPRTDMTELDQKMRKLLKFYVTSREVKELQLKNLSACYGYVIFISAVLCRK